MKQVIDAIIVNSRFVQDMKNGCAELLKDQPMLVIQQFLGGDVYSQQYKTTRWNMGLLMAMDGKTVGVLKDQHMVLLGSLEAKQHLQKFQKISKVSVKPYHDKPSGTRE